MKNYTEFITELFDSSIETQLNILIEENDEFKVEFEYEGDTYFFQSRYENKIFPEFIRFGWHLGFGKGSNDEKYLPTGKGFPFKILSLIKKSLDMFIERYNPKQMSFIAEGDAKANIYLSFFNKYNIEKEESGLDSLTGKTPYLFKISI